jgi:hypothetical protein
MIIKRRSSGANFIPEVSTTEPYLDNPESDRSKCMSMFTKLCLKSVCNFIRIDSLVPEKSNARSLITPHPKLTFNGFQSTKWENNYAISRILETDFLCLFFRRVHALEINLRERWAPGLSMWPWGIELSIGRYQALLSWLVHLADLFPETHFQLRSRIFHVLSICQMHGR